MKVSYEWLATFFEEGALPPVEEVEQKLIFHAYEVEGVERAGDDQVIDIDVLPNRSSDSLSHRGIAREISTLFSIPMKDDPLRKEVSCEPQTTNVTVTLSDDASCSYYVAAHVHGVSVDESPAWLQKRLQALGQKSINNVVDATNYVLFGLGQPTHVFDAQKCSGKIATRRAHNGEHIELLGGSDVELDESMTLIVDAETDTPLAIAGVKGGTAAEVTAETTEVIVESALFDPVETRKTAQKLKLRTDASARFENEVPQPLPAYGAEAVVQLLAEIAGGTCEGYAVAGSPQGESSPITLSGSRIERLLGVAIDEKEIASIFDRLQFAHTIEGDSLSVTPPFERTDVRIPEDVIEEVGRVYGYNNIVSQQLSMPPEREPHVHKKYAYIERIRAALDTAGCTEVYLYSLRASGEVTLRNALASDKNHLRDSLAQGVTETLDTNERNMPLLGLYDAVRVYEIGNVFTKDSEATHVAVGVRVAGSKKKEARTVEAFAPIREALQEVLPGVELPEPQGEVLECNLDALIGDLPDVEGYPAGGAIDSSVTYTSVSQYPFVLRDIAVWVTEGVTVEEAEGIIRAHGGDLLKRCDLFDTFEKDGRVSYAFHLVFQSDTETLTDEKVGAIMAAIESDMQSRDGWEIR